MPCDHKSEAHRISEALASAGCGRTRVEGYGDHHVVLVEVCEDFYAFVSVSCEDGRYYYEFAVGDENFTVSLEKVDCLDKAVEVVRRVRDLAVPRQTGHPASSRPSGGS